MARTPSRVSANAGPPARSSQAGENSATSTSATTCVMSSRAALGPALALALALPLALVLLAPAPSGGVQSASKLAARAGSRRAGSCMAAVTAWAREGGSSPSVTALG